ncbi:hypothetical protein [uncultured Chryseobacterium sp.]|uniref:hypothetical protein n=3 Tax=uncultured Chryseobacterium sp. TaxID=259322 RepID=UPI0025F28C28|nr:hypothetical protein [uncultured Chryseobacterium sp.]
MKKKYMALVLGLVLQVTLNAQNGNVGIGTTNPKAALDIVSAKNGILIPRMTAVQVEQITTPHESELVYSLSDSSSVINKKGFWFYYLGTWRPLLENIPNSNINFYNADGTLNSVRTVTQNGKYLNIGPGLLYISGTASTIGILTDSPTQAFDVNGDIRIQSLTSGGSVISDANGVLSLESFHNIGDVKPSYVNADHDGWYLLDGRSVSTLPAVAQSNASSVLGINTVLPDASEKYSSGTTGSAGFVTGSNTVTLTRDNLPSFNFTYTTNPAGSHSHTVTYEKVRINTMNGGANNIHAYWLEGTYSAGADYSVGSSFTQHTHTYSVGSGGSSLPLDIRPAALNFNYFVYLGK